MRPWNNQYKAIVGGAQYIGSNYIARGQNTLYLEKFNVTPNSTYSHQYMSNVMGAYSEAAKTYDAYKEWMAAQPIVFYIPVYNSMPDTAVAAPLGNLNPNNYLGSITVTGDTQASYQTSPAFGTGWNRYLQYHSTCIRDRSYDNSRTCKRICKSSRHRQDNAFKYRNQCTDNSYGTERKC